MSKVTSRDQALEIIAKAMVNINWDGVNGELLQTDVISLKPAEIGQRFTAFLNNGCRLIIGEPRIIRINPDLKFDPTEFIGSGWTVWKGPADGDGLKGEQDLDKRSLALTEVDLAAAIFESGLKKGESSINGEEKLKRLRSSANTQFGGNVFLALWQDYQQNKENSCLEWLWRNRKISWVSFFGLVLRSPHGSRHVLFLCRSGGVWYWGYIWLGDGWVASFLSAGLAS
jgi:hypothetical protein